MRNTTFVLLALLGFGCASTEGPAFERRGPPPSLSAERVAVDVVDARPHVDQRAFEISAFTFGFQGQEMSPPLDAALAASWQRSLADRLQAGARALRIEVTVRAALAGWDGNAMSEEEHASARLEIAVFDAATDRSLVTGTSESWGRRSSLDTSVGEVQRVFSAVLHDAFYSCLESQEVRAALAGP